MAKRAASSTTKRKSAGSSARSKRTSTAKRSSSKRSTGRRGAKTDWEQIGRTLTNGSLWGAAAVLLGVFTILALMSEPGAFTGWWVDQLSQTFGLGRFMIPIVLVALGVYLFLRSGGHAANIAFTRVLGVFILWIAFQMGSNLVAQLADPWTFAESTASDYGGEFGLALSDTLQQVMGAWMALALVVLLAIVGVVLVLGISFTDMMAAARTVGQTASTQVDSLPDRLRRDPDPIGGRSSRWDSLKRWFVARRAARTTTRDPYNGMDGPITTLPPDLTKPSTAGKSEPVPPTVRIIGAEQTNWRLPQVDHILDDFAGTDLTEDDLAERARIIEDTLSAFGVPVTVTEVNRGPVVTQFGLRPGYVNRKVRGEDKRMKVRVSRIQALSNDLSLALAAAPIRIEAPVPGRDIVGLEVPNSNVAMVSLRSIIESEEFNHLKGPLRICLGQDVSGRAVAASLARMPHLLVAGATGSGKSVCINASICSLLFQYTPDQLRFVMVDPKRVELTGYNGIPHLIDSVVTDIDKVVGVLHWATTEMDRRYKELERAGARNIEAYNARRVGEGKSELPYIVIVIDELADIMMMSPEEVERSLVRLAQMARATGIHLVIATQRPSVNVVTGLIKANFPSRVAFAVTSQIDSRVILDTPGAERLLGRGDMLFMRPDSAKLARLQGAFVSDAEVQRLVRYWRGLGSAPTGGMQPTGDSSFVDDDEFAQPGEPEVQRPLWDEVIAQAEEQANRDVLYDDAVAIVQESGRASTSLLQRRLRIGYTRAARLIDMMEENGLVGPDQGGSRGREVLEMEDVGEEEV
ncbi:MAG: DNA translocase FtsK 4TM domain-containing protein [Caldilineales bacterium]|nr:DNA translocase FtsK 4TM domain-containing protein [Caldilineales bacterium]